MKMNRLNYVKVFLYLTLILVHVACEKDKTSPAPESPLVLPRNERLLLASTFASGVKEIKYNADRQPESFLASGMKIDVSYSKSSVTYSYYGKELLAKKVYDTEGGLVKTLTEYNYHGKTEQKGFSRTFEYQDGKMVKEIITYENKPFANIDYSYDNVHENLTAAKTYDHSGNLLTTSSYEYTDKLDKSGSHSEWNIAVDGTLFPKKAKYLIKKATTEDHFEKITLTTEYEYELDNSGYVVSGKGKRSPGSEYKWTNTWE